jgi:hypothetical protein
VVRLILVPRYLRLLPGNSASYLLVRALVLLVRTRGEKYGAPYLITTHMCTSRTTRSHTTLVPPYGHPTHPRVVFIVPAIQSPPYGAPYGEPVGCNMPYDWIRMDFLVRLVPCYGASPVPLVRTPVVETRSILITGSPR